MDPDERGAKLWLDELISHKFAEELAFIGQLLWRGIYGLELLDKTIRLSISKLFIKSYLTKVP